MTRLNENPPTGTPEIALSEIIRLVYAYVKIQNPAKRQMLLEIAECESRHANKKFKEKRGENSCAREPEA